MSLKYQVGNGKPEMLFGLISVILPFVFVLPDFSVGYCLEVFKSVYVFIFISLLNKLLPSLPSASLISQSCLNGIHRAQALMEVMLRYWKIEKIKSGGLKKSDNKSTTVAYYSYCR